VAVAADVVPETQLQARPELAVTDHRSPAKIVAAAH
jgi:hypothetical protein